MLRVLIIVSTLLFTPACSSGESEADRHVVEGSTTLLNPKGEFDEDAARDDAKADVDASTFEGSGDTSLCTSDCSGHEAGFEWAKENDVSDASDCSGQSDSFVEGCESYAAAIQSQVDDERQQHEDKDDGG